MKNIFLIQIFFLLIGFYNSILSTVFIPPRIYVHSYEPLDNAKRISSFPFISGDTYRSLAQVFIDELRMSLDPSTLKDGDIIFLKTDFLKYFFTVVHPEITTKYILICANSDASAPGKFAHMLDDNKLIAWFTVNVDTAIAHAKLIPIPIGIANRYRSSGKIELLQALRNKFFAYPKDLLLYLNMNLATKPSIRNEVYEIFSGKPYCYHSKSKPWPEYLIDLVKSKFVLSPHGNGLDCYRTWETLLLGGIPIVKTSTLDSLYEDLPVLIVKDWNEVTEDFLNKKWIEMQGKKYKKEKIYALYWLDQIKKCQQDFLQSSRASD